MENTDKPRFRGKTIDLGGTDYVIPPLSFRQVQELSDDISRITALRQRVLEGDADAGTEVFVLMADVAHAAMSRNYPHLSKAELSDLLDMGNIREVFACVMGVSGFTQREGGQADGGGGPLTGGPSTLT